MSQLLSVVCIATFLCTHYICAEYSLDNSDGNEMEMDKKNAYVRLAKAYDPTQIRLAKKKFNFRLAKKGDYETDYDDEEQGKRSPSNRWARLNYRLAKKSKLVRLARPSPNIFNMEKRGKYVRLA